jgi:centromeric protein E
MQGSGTIQQGSESEHASGIIHMAAQDIFKHIDSRPDRLFMVRASFLEVYNEEVRDLLSDVSSKLKVQESNGVVTTECKEVPVSDWKSLLEILAQGEQSRTFASTAMNERSSRSHTIFRVTLESRSKGEEEEHDGTSLISTLNLVDLAGSESVRHTGATGERQVEGAKINKRYTFYRGGLAGSKSSFCTHLARCDSVWFLQSPDALSSYRRFGDWKDSRGVPRIESYPPASIVSFGKCANGVHLLRDTLRELP